VSASAQRRRVLVDAHRHVAALHHARRAQPEAHSADAAVQARSTAHRLAVSQLMVPVPVLRLALAEPVVPGVRPEAAEVQSSARALLSELPQAAEAEEEAQPWVPQEAVEVQPWAELAEVAVVQPSAQQVAAEPGVPQAVQDAQPAEVEEEAQPWVLQEAVEVQPWAELAEVAVVQPSEVRAAEAEQPWAAQAVVRAQPSEALEERLSAVPSVLRALRLAR
jgi:hypothetical protein